MKDKTLVPVHVAWNGSDETLTNVEFTSDCEFLALETDVIDGDLIAISGKTFSVYLTQADMDAGNGAVFEFVDIQYSVGNAYWDMLWMRPEQAAKFAIWLQQQKHWTVSVGDGVVVALWGTFAESQLEKLFKCMMENFND
jgi:hypothetical protein